MPAFTGTPRGWVVPALICALATVLDVTLAIAANSVWEWISVDWMGLWSYSA